MIEYDNIFYLLMAFGFVMLNAFFVMSEFSLVKLRSSQVKILQANKGLQGKVLHKVHSKLDIYLSACQLGITLASLGLGWVGEPAFSELLEPVFISLDITSVKLSKFIAFAVGFAIISFLHIVIGELMPKSMAIRQTERLSLLTCIPLYIFYWVMFPFIWVLNSTANLLLKIFRLDVTDDNNHGYTSEEVKLILKSSHFRKPLTEEHRAILLRIVEFSGLQAVDAMRPVKEMIAIDDNLSAKQRLDVVKNNLYTRYPVYRDSLSNIIGVIHTKDILCALDDDSKKTELRPILKVSHHDPLIDVLKKFQQGKPHFALVYKHKQLAGFITLDNLLTILIGRMSDEFHLVKEPWKALGSKKFLIKADAPVYAIERLAGVDLSGYPADTVDDLLRYVLEGNLAVGRAWDQGNYTVTIKTVKKSTLREIVLELKN